MNCPKCNHPFEAGQKFCSACGNPLPVQTERKCPNCHAKVEQNQKFCAACGTNLQQSSTSPQTPPPRSAYSYNPANGSAASMRCPECGKMTDSLKQATLFDQLLFVGIYTQWKTGKYTCCPECMRKHIANRTAANMIPGNLMWAALALPLHGYHLFQSYQPGHSKGVS